jgi:hypothetical protein
VQIKREVESMAAEKQRLSRTIDIDHLSEEVAISDCKLVFSAFGSVVGAAAVYVGDTSWTARVEYAAPHEAYAALAFHGNAIKGSPVGVRPAADLLPVVPTHAAEPLSAMPKSMARPTEKPPVFPPEPPAKARPRDARGSIERRVDPTDGEMYTLAEFIEEYGGSASNPPLQWREQATTAFLFKE